MRMHTRLMMRSRKRSRTMHMVALYTVWYNFVRIHKTLTGAPAAGITKSLMKMGDLVAMVDAACHEREAKRPKLVAVANWVTTCPWPMQTRSASTARRGTGGPSRRDRPAA